MKKEFVIKKCFKCGAIIKVIEDCECEECGIICCNEKMTVLKPNSVDAAKEKHVPTYELAEGKLKIFVNHVMEEEHFIEWIGLKTEEKEEFIFLKPGKEAMAVFDNVTSGIIYAYCNKHGLWSAKIGK